MKKQFNKDLVVTKKDNEDFKNSTKYWICDHVYDEGNIKVRDHSYLCILSFYSALIIT